ncbi:MAG TPA: hypothetical protein VE465_02220 [Streptosporangiaceae bacterium]|jgi:hypothetical protein|nr:hypothetical protein [Streptosporangiaceae bacterium]
MTEINDALRDHVTAVGFQLTLGKTHLAQLVYLDLLLKENQPAIDPKTDKFDQGRVRSPRGAPWNNSAVGLQGLERRGLVKHILDQHRKPGEQVLTMTPRRIWKITKAGRLVINLLKEAGIYQEYAAAIPIRREAAS